MQKFQKDRLIGKSVSKLKDNQTSLDQKFEINQQNVKILKKIIDARQINVKSRERLVSGIRNEENRASSSRNATLRADLKKQSEIAHRNQKLAIKLFTSKPTYQIVNFERQFQQR